MATDTVVKRGSRKGIPNKRRAQLLAKIEKSGLSPLDYLLSVMRDPTQDQAVRLSAATSAAPYVHAKLASITHSGPEGGPVNLNLHVQFVGAHNGNS